MELIGRVLRLEIKFRNANLFAIDMAHHFLDAQDRWLLMDDKKIRNCSRSSSHGDTEARSSTWKAETDISAQYVAFSDVLAHSNHNTVRHYVTATSQSVT